MGALGAIPCLLVAIISLILFLPPLAPGFLGRAMHMRHTASHSDVTFMLESYASMLRGARLLTTVLATMFLYTQSSPEICHRVMGRGCTA